MGLGTRTKAWRFTEVNKDYSVIITYRRIIQFRWIDIFASFVQPILQHWSYQPVLAMLPFLTPPSIEVKLVFLLYLTSTGETL
jgi:hypothetical protein